MHQYLTVAYLLSQLESDCSQNKHCVLLLLLVLKWPTIWDLTQNLKKTSNEKEIKNMQNMQNMQNIHNMQKVQKVHNMQELQNVQNMQLLWEIF